MPQSPHPTFQTSDQLRDPDWDSFVASTPGAHFEQTSGWGSVRARYGWEVFRILAFADGKIVGGVQVLSRRFGRWGRVGFVNRGPVAAQGREELAEQLAQRVSNRARSESWLYCVVDYPDYAHALAARMAATGYFPHPSAIPPAGLLTATALVDLRPDLEVVLGGMNANVRRDIRRAQRSELRFDLGGPDDLPRFRELMVATCARRVGYKYSAPQPSQSDYFINLWNELGKQEWVRLFLVRYRDEIVSAAFAFTISDTVRVWKVGWSGGYGNKEPNRLMWWETMRWAKANGFQALDFVWIDSEDAKRVARGEFSPEGFRDGTTYFKMGFGSSLHFPPPAQSCFYHPILRMASRFGGARLLASASIQRGILRLWSRATRRK
jgi:lipid II:glycine glycyltransferase (peptidoglycan interpeptide bridge formation enzyme)